MTDKNKVLKAKTAGKNKAALSTDQPQPQESSKKRELLDSVQQDYIAQSNTLSIVNRTITGVILGTIWAICYKENAIKTPNIWLTFSLILSLIFFLIELAHYFTDSRFYHNMSDEMVKSEMNFDYKKKHKEIQRHSKCSYRFLLAKSGVVLLLSIIFVIGICCLSQSSRIEETNYNPEFLQKDSVISITP